MPRVVPALDQRGYSMVELLTVFVVLLIAAAIAVPRMGNWMGGVRAAGALDRFAVDVAYARSLAQREAAEVVIRFENDSTYVVVAPAGATRRVNLGHDYPGIVVVPPAAELVFDASGHLRDVGTGVIRSRAGAARDSAYLSVAGWVHHAQ